MARIMCARRGCLVDTNPFTIMRISRSLRCAASSSLRIFFRKVTSLFSRRPTQLRQSFDLEEALCHIRRYLLRDDGRSPSAAPSAGVRILGAPGELRSAETETAVLLDFGTDRAEAYSKQ